MESSSKLFILFSIFFLLLSTLSQPAAAADSINIGEDPVSRYRTLLALQRKTNRNQIPNCGEMMSRSQCSQNPKCRWCRSEALDDMCFGKTEARRLPQQVFLCDWFNSLSFFLLHCILYRYCSSGDNCNSFSFFLWTSEFGCCLWSDLWCGVSVPFSEGVFVFPSSSWLANYSWIMSTFFSFGLI